MKANKYENRLNTIDMVKSSNLNKLIPAGICLYIGAESFVDIAHYIYYFKNLSFWLFSTIGILTITSYLMGILLSLTPTPKTSGNKKKKEQLKNRELWCTKSTWYTKSSIALLIIQGVFLFKINWALRFGYLPN